MYVVENEENGKSIKYTLGELETRVIDGKVKNVFIISDNAFQQAYDAHQRWYEKFKDKLYYEANRIVFLVI